MNWRKLNRRIHQDLGYFFVGLTIIYSVSGIALNHLHHWNPDLKTEDYSGAYNEPYNFGENKMEAAKQVADAAGINYPIKSVISKGQNIYRVFLDVGSGNTGKIVVDANDKTFSVQIARQRQVFKQMNLMHRNNLKKIWTWVSDIFAIALIWLAISGAIIMRGKFGFKRYGIWLVLAGTIIPLIIFFIYQ
ncbi:MAG: PepSY-associated TM helix domain-containing protein [Salinivirgaceae bacterium]|jgi:hypothetical protein